MKKWFANCKIAAKLIIGFLIVACIAGIVGAVGLINIKTLADTDKLLYEENTLGIVYSGDANTYFQRLRYNISEMIILKDNTQKADYINKFNNFIAAIDVNLKDYEDGIITQTDRNLFDPLKTDWEQYKSYMQQVIKLAEAGQYDQAQRVFLGEADALSGSLMDSFVNLYQYNTTGAETRSANNTRLASTAMWIMLGVILAAMVVAISLGLSIARHICKPLSKMVEAADKLAHGNFDVSIHADSRDETGMLAQSFGNMADTLKTIIADLSRGLEAFADGNFTLDSQAQASYVGDYAPLLASIRKMRDNLSNTLRHINTAAEQVATGADQVSSGAQALAAGSTEQAASVEELTASVEKIAEKAEENSSVVMAASKSVQQAGIGVSDGNEHMKHLTQAMADISSASSQIANITKVIEDIAFQTNILALNAAIEAARAGNAGKGFAVVADEVRNLAAKSAEAAKQTADLIQTSVSTVARGAEISHQTEQILREVGASAAEVTNGFEKIERSIAEQTIAIEQIKDGLAQVSDVVQTNAATAEENSATSEEMSAQAAVLRAEVGKFRLTDESKDPKGPASMPSVSLASGKY